jgi:cytochrome b561
MVALVLTADCLPRGPLRSGVWSAHVILDYALALVPSTRIAWQAHFGRVLPPVDAGVLYAAAKATHYTLYALLAAVVETGIVNASCRGSNLFGAGDTAIQCNISGWHKLAANLILLVAFPQAVVVLVHQYVWCDRLLNRMIL